MNNTLSVIILNCRSLNSKLGDIKLLLYTEKADIMCLSETWLKETQYNPKFIDYNCIYKNRATNAGGIAIVIKRNIKYHEINLKPYQNGKLEIQAIKIFTEASQEIVLLNLYNPNEDIHELEFQHYVDQIGNKYVIVGDFNAHTPLLDTKCNRSNKMGKALERIIEQDMVCIINPLNFYTYLDFRNGKLSCLDLCLTSANLAAYAKMEKSKDVGSDHRAIKVEIAISIMRTMINTKRKWIITNPTLREYSNNVEKSTLIEPCAVENMAEDMEQRIVKAADEHIKMTTGKGRQQKCSLVEFRMPDCSKYKESSKA